MLDTTLGELAEITMGQSPKSESLIYEKSGATPFLQGNRTFGSMFPNIDTYTVVPTKLAKAGDVLMSVRAPVGDINIAPEDLCIGRGLCSLRMRNDNQKFLFYLLRYYSKKLVAQESGTVFGSVNKSDIANLQVRVPKDPSIQRRISSILSAFDEKIQTNQKINDNLS